MEHREESRCDAPDPVLLAVVFEAGLIAAELFLLRDRILQFLVARIQRIRNQSRAELGQTREFDELVCLEFVGRFQFEPLDVFVGNFIVECFIDAFRWQIFPQMLLMPGLATTFWLTASPWLFLKSSAW